MSRSLRDLSSHLSSGQTLTGVAFNSMRVEPGHAFFALPGAATHGIHYADEALSQGALLVISDRPHPQGVLVSDPAALLIEFGSNARNNWSAPVIGITGSVGKTTTKDLLAAALSCPSSPGNRNTTLALAAEMINLAEAGKSTEPLVLELGIDQIGEMAALIELARPSHGLITSIAESHLDGLGDLATVAREKAKLLETAIHSYADIAAVDHLRPELRTRVTTYGLKGEGADAEADLSAEPAGAPVLKLAGTTFRLPGVGRSVARNAAGALALATDLGVAPELAASRMTHVAPAAGRLQLHAIKGTTLIDDSYNSNPTSLAAAFEVLLASPRPQTAILGDMLELGDRADELHLTFSPLAMQVDRLVTVGKRAGLIAPEHGEALRLADAPEAVASLGQLRLEGTLLVKGSRGMRLDLVTEALLQSGGTLVTLPLAAVLGWLFTGGFLALARQRNWGKAIRDKGPEGHKVKEGTPTLGGVAFLAAAVGCWALIGPHSLESAVVVALVLASGLLGLLDDLLALRRRGEETTGLLARYRLLIQGVLGLAFAFFAVRQDLGPIGISTLDTPLLALIVVGTINGFNFTDGLDGLAAGVAAIVLLAFLAAPFGAPLLGALLGFLWFNAFPARIFMGGVGSEALGAAVASIAILEGMVWYLPLVALIPVLEVLSVIVQVSYFRITGGRRLLRMSPLHHHFELSGWSEQRVVTRFWIVTALAVAAAAWLKGTAS